MSNIQVTKFIALVNARLCKDSLESALQLQEMWKEVSSYPVCAAIVLKGDRQGQACGKAAVKGQAFCMCHTPREKKEKPVKVQLQCSECPTVLRKGQTQCKDHRVYVTCNMVLTKGSRKGEVCGKKGMCPRHNGKEQVVSIEAKETKSTIVPQVIQERVVVVAEEQEDQPFVMATAAASTSEQKKEKVIKEKVVKEKKEKVIKEKVIKEKKQKVVEEKIVQVPVVEIQVKQEPVEEEQPVVIATAAVSSSEQKKDSKEKVVKEKVVKEKVVKEKKDKVVKEKKDVKETVSIAPMGMVPSPILIPIATPTQTQVVGKQVYVPHSPDYPPPTQTQVVEKQVYVPRSPDYPPPSHMEELSHNVVKK